MLSTDQVVEKEGKRYKIVEHPIDPPNTIRRTLVEVDTTEDDIPEGATLLSEQETVGLLAKQGKPERILVGDPVRLRVGDASKVGSVKSKLKSGKFSVKWEDGTTERYEALELAKVY